MNMIIGQEKLCSRIDDLTLDTFPRTLMLVGPEGSGKHLLVDYVSKKLNLQVIDITTSLNQDYIEELYNRVEPYIYLIKANELSVKEENTILKFIEEPLKNSYVILIAETDIGILPTILNRCQIWYLQNYSRETLKQFLTTDNEYILTIANTPGQVIDLCNTSFNDMLELAHKIVSKIEIASVANTLTLSNKIGFKKEANKFNVNLFVTVLTQTIVDCCKNTNDQRYVSAYMLTSELKKKLAVKNLDTKALFEKYLINLRAIMRGESI